jgi:hypothetical protein
MAALDINERIFATEAEIESCSEFLPRQLNRHWVAFIAMSRNVMASLTANPAEKRPFRHCYSLSNGGFFVAPGTADERLKVIWPTNYFEAEMSQEAAGILACLLTLASLWGHTEDDSLAEHYHALLDYANQHTESSTIFRAMD